jgi:hypothetical protein
MDLRSRYPRSVKEKLAGYVHVGRMIDKCRAALAGTLGEYVYPCPMDRHLLDFAGLTPEQFLEAVKGHRDEAMIDWFRTHTASRSGSEIEAWNETMLALGPDTEEKWEYFRSCRNAVDPSRTDITTWADLLDLEEQRPVPQQKVIRGSHEAK